MFDTHPGKKKYIFCVDEKQGLDMLPKSDDDSDRCSPPLNLLYDVNRFCYPASALKTVLLAVRIVLYTCAWTIAFSADCEAKQLTKEEIYK